ncbi:D-xylose transport system substrate-binding protein [Caldalkalibacillus uzonensis]|uniref:D-xylose transport system substrate-binding protein n=2 Tax=Caldalkalibacillus uzonensis TaxID=353224 RepID=A0ABU0CRA2_9BACI|nr:D-xylose transport system substrate-binding protein [Caldalkalibacillus uzonensis]
MKRLLLFMVVAGLLLVALVGCTTEEPAGSEPTGSSEGSSADSDTIKIGLSLATLQEERWQRDRDSFVERAEELGAEVLVQSANLDEATQISQAENLLTQGVDVLVVVPINADTAAAIVDSANEAGVPVIAYDRMINNSDVTVYMSFDNFRVGQMQAEYITNLVPEGNYVLIGGAPTDNNAHLFRDGQMDVLQPFIDSGAIKIVHDEWADNWQPENALNIMENALTANNNNVDAVIASNDGTAGGAIQALEAQGLAGKVPISGQDAELSAVQRIVEGTQSMTVYKPLNLLAHHAAEVAIALAKGEELEYDTTINNGKIDVPSILLEPIVVDADNVYEVIVKSGFHSLEDVYRNVPREQWPTD